MKYIFYIITVLFFCKSLVYSQEYFEGDDVFKLGTTPFIYANEIGLFFSYGINYGNPDLLLDQWRLPHADNSVLFRESEVGLTLYKRVHLFLKYSKAYSSYYGYSSIGESEIRKSYSLGFKWKIFKSSGYFPDFSIKVLFPFDSYVSPLTISLGSARNKFKYYFSVGITPYYYIPIPKEVTLGISYVTFKHINLFFEINTTPDKGWGISYFSSLRTGFNFKFTNNLSFNISYFNFNFDFAESIPFRDGQIWKDPSSIISAPDKGNYHLFSADINLYFNNELFSKIFR